MSVVANLNFNPFQSVHAADVIVVRSVSSDVTSFTEQKRLDIENGVYDCLPRSETFCPVLFVHKSRKKIQTFKNFQKPENCSGPQIYRCIYSLSTVAVFVGFTMCAERNQKQLHSCEIIDLCSVLLTDVHGRTNLFGRISL